MCNIDKKDMLIHTESVQNKTGIHINALYYRIVTKGFVGTLVVFASCMLVGILLYVLKIHNALIYSLIAFLSVFLVQLLLVIVTSFLEYKNLEYSIEQNSIALQEGTFSIHTETIPFDKIKNSSFDQSLTQRFFSVGDIIIDQGDEKFVWDSIDGKTAGLIMEAVSAKSNIQPITVQMATAQSATPPQK